MSDKAKPTTGDKEKAEESQEKEKDAEEPMETEVESAGSFKSAY